MSERDRIGRLVERFGAAPIAVATGDDAAVVVPGGGVSVTSVDSIVDGVHFLRNNWPLRAVGQKAAAAALSDLAAMGAAAGELYVAAGVPADLDEAGFDQLIDGLATAASAASAQIAGGDLVASAQLWLSVTVVGYAESAEHVVERSGAAASDAVVLTGDVGGAGRALELIERGATDDSTPLAKQFAPAPRIEAGRLLAAHGATAMIDVSDGLAGDAAQLSAASDVRLTLEADRIPLADGVTDLQAALASGEEYELLATIPESKLESASQAVLASGTRLTRIGSVEVGSGVRLVDPDRVELDLDLRGFDHFD